MEQSTGFLIVLLMMAGLFVISYQGFRATVEDGYGWFESREDGAFAMSVGMLAIFLTPILYVSIAPPPPEGEKIAVQEVPDVATPNPKRSVVAGATDDKKLAWVMRTQDAIGRKLKDSGSAQFRNSRFATWQGHPMVCGEVNGKNSFGGYSGYQRFVGSDAITLLEEDAADGEFSKVWNDVCP